MKEPDDKLAASLDRELKRLPERKAPQILATSVMHLVRKYESRPWWQRSWFEWPAGLRWFSALVMLAMLAGMGSADVAGLQTAIARGTATLNEVSAMLFGTFSPVLEFVGSLIANIPFFVWCLVAVGFTMSWIASLGLGVVCYQLIRTRKHKH